MLNMCLNFYPFAEILQFVPWYFNAILTDLLQFWKRLIKYFEAEEAVIA